MNPPSAILKDFLVTEGIGVFGAATGWSIHVGVEPEEPDTTITLYDTPGEEPNPKWLVDYPHWQIRVRGAPNSYLGGYNKAAEVKAAMLGLPSQELGGIIFAGIYVITDIFLLMNDKKGRPIFVTNWRGIIHLPDGTGNRLSL